MSERERLDGYLDDFGQRLGAAASVAPRPRRRRPLAFAVTAAVAAAVVVTIALGASGDRLDPVAQAQAALAPPGEIVYMKITSETIAPKANSVPPPRTTQQWSARDPLRWRFVETIPRPDARLAAISDKLGLPFGRHETAYADGVRRSYFAERDAITVTRGYRDDEPAARLPSILGSGSGDPEADLRSMLFDGDVRDEGEQQVGGRTVRRFVSTIRRDGPSDPAMVLRLVYDVDPQTFAPIEGRMSTTFPAIDDAPRAVLRMRVDDYERIPLDETTTKLLEIRTTPRTKVTNDTAQALRERHRRWMQRCRPLRSGDAACKTLPPGP